MHRMQRQVKGARSLLPEVKGSLSMRNKNTHSPFMHNVLFPMRGPHDLKTIIIATCNHHIQVLLNMK